MGTLLISLGPLVHFSFLSRVVGSKEINVEPGDYFTATRRGSLLKDYENKEPTDYSVFFPINEPSGRKENNGKSVGNLFIFVAKVIARLLFCFILIRFQKKKKWESNEKQKDEPNT